MTTLADVCLCGACGGKQTALTAWVSSFARNIAKVEFRCDACGAQNIVQVSRELLAQYRLPESAPDLAPAPAPDPGPSLRALDGSVIGYRAWRIQGWQLTGTGQPMPWEPGVNEARCASSLTFMFAGSHSAPDPDCQCGLYALARFDEGKAWWQNAAVLGAVEAWADPTPDNSDRFFVHSTGFRAQYAKVVLLATSDEYPRAKNAAIRALAAEHGADVCRAEHLEDAAKEHGQLVPDEWLEWAREPADPGRRARLQTGGAAAIGWTSVVAVARGPFAPSIQPDSEVDHGHKRCATTVASQGSLTSHRTSRAARHRQVPQACSGA